MIIDIPKIRPTKKELLLNGRDKIIQTVLFSISLENGISHLGTIDHDEFFNSPCEKLPPDGTPAPIIPCEPDYLPWGTQPNRTVFMSDEQNTLIYTLSNVGIKAVDTANITNVVGDLRYINP